jgi:hypothetical protein
MARIINAGSADVTYECVPRPNCPGCGAEWDDEMVALFDLALGLGCGCCNPFADQLPDIVCHRCKKVLYSTREQPPETAPPPTSAPVDDLDLTPR